MSTERAMPWRGLPLLVMVLLFTGSAAAEVCPGAKVPKAEHEQYDAQAMLSPTDTEVALRTHLPWGQPVCPRLLPGQEWGPSCGQRTDLATRG